MIVVPRSCILLFGLRRPPKVVSRLPTKGSFISCVSIAVYFFFLKDAGVSKTVKSCGAESNSCKILASNFVCFYVFTYIKLHPTSYREVEYCTSRSRESALGVQSQLTVSGFWSNHQNKKKTWNPRTSAPTEEPITMQDLHSTGEVT